MPLGAVTQKHRRWEIASTRTGVVHTMFPPNIARILFQWTAPATHVFRLHFDTGKGTLDVYTDGAHDTCTKAETGGYVYNSGHYQLSVSVR